jgi:hypothetical protein
MVNAHMNRPVASRSSLQSFDSRKTLGMYRSSLIEKVARALRICLCLKLGKTFYFFSETRPCGSDNNF